MRCLSGWTAYLFSLTDFSNTVEIQGLVGWLGFFVLDSTNVSCSSPYGHIEAHMYFFFFNVVLIFKCWAKK